MDVGAESYRVTMESTLACSVAYGRLESPLEAAFLIWWKVVGESQQYPFDIHPQVDIDLPGDVRFRADFELVPTQTTPHFIQQCTALGLSVPRFAIELDGHDFHERTKEQVEIRNRRDRLLQDANWRVIHFSGSEFHRDPFACIEAAFKSAHGVISTLERRAWAIELSDALSR